MDVPEFLLARIDEDEAAHRQRRSLIGVGDHKLWCMEADYDDGLCGYCGAAVTRAEPVARVLAECEAHRLIVPLHQPMYLTWCPSPTCSVCIDFSEEPRPHPLGPPTLWQPHLAWPCPTLRALASIYADHPDYQPEWAL